MGRRMLGTAQSMPSSPLTVCTRKPLYLNTTSSPMFHTTATAASALRPFSLPATARANAS